MKLTTASYLLGLSSVFFQSVDAELFEISQMSKKWGDGIKNGERTEPKTIEEIQKMINWSEVRFRTDLSDDSTKPFDKSDMVEYKHPTNPNKKLCRNIDFWKVTHKDGKVQKVYSKESDVADVWEAYPGATSEVSYSIESFFFFHL